jgi:eukaryotic-like serine/threonine-protein kinase
MIGTVIGTYRLEEKLGDGGLGGVYRAVDGTSGKEAAFRVFAREVSADPMLADRLRAMAPALKKLQHPNIAAFYELVSVGPDLALFLEYVPGASLDRVRQPGARLETNVSVSCAVQVLRALEFSHSAGVLHHALRPSNVAVTRQGTVKVLDFGIGHAFGANRKTREDRLLTVVAYLAPEQIQNEPGDARSDIYSVGVLLYELLTGRLPFDHKTEFALRQAHLGEPPAAPRTIAPDLPEWLDQAVLRALAKSPASRYQNATEFRAVLEAALGLSTSREAAIVRQRGGAPVQTFAAAPPIPAPVAPAPGGATLQGSSADATVMAAAPLPGGAGDAVTVAGTAPVSNAATPTAASGPAPPARSAAAAKPRRAMAIGASVILLLVVAAAGVYLTTSRSAPPPEPAASAPPAGTSAAPPAAPPAAPQAEAAPASPAPASSAPAVSAAPGAPQAADRKPQVKPPPVARTTPLAPSVVASPAAATPPGALAAPAAPAPAPKTETAPDVSFHKIKLVTQAGSSEKATDVVLMLGADRLSVTPAGGGAALRTVTYAEVTAASYSKAQRRRLGFISSAQHLLEIDTAGDPLLLRLDKDNVESILAALEARTGRAVSR